MLAKLCAAGLKPSLFFLDNECPQVLKDHFDHEHIDYQLVPPVQHRRNAAERAIRTWKNHFIAILAAADDGFPLHLWDRLLFQADLTLNLLRGSRINPKLSAWAQIYGHFDYNRTPIAPLGTRVLAHEPATTRPTWGPHAKEGWYVGPALDSYRCFTIWLDETRRTRIIERCTWFPAKLRVPIPTSADLLNDALRALSEALQQPQASTVLESLDAERRDALQTLGTILSNSDSQAAADLAALPAPAQANFAHPAPRVPPDPVPSPRVPTPCAYAASFMGAREFCGKVFHPDTGKLVEYVDLRTSSEGARWEEACAKEWARLLQGLPPKYPTGRDTFKFIHRRDVPSNKKVTYLRVVANYRPQKADPYRIRFTVGGDRLDYDGDTYVDTSDLTTFKIAVNAVLSKPGCRACTIDLSDFYICHRLPSPEYMRIHRSLIPQSIIDHYHVEQYIDADGFVYVEIGGAMYGLKQVGRISNQELVSRLCVAHFYPCRHTPGLFRHNSRDIFFTLIVDDFFVGYTATPDVTYLLTLLQEKYDATVDWSASIFSGIHLKWDYEARTCDLSMPGYIDKALHRFEHPPPSRPQDSPHPWTAPVYGATTQLEAAPDLAPPVDKKSRTRIQEILGTLLFYARAVDDTMLLAINTLASEQATATKTTVERIVQLLNYAATHPDAIVRYHASDMYLWVHSDASYLSEADSRSRYAGYFFLSRRPRDPTVAPIPGEAPPPLNGPILVVTHKLKEVVASAAEAELGGLFHNCREAEPIRITLDELGFPQGPTPIQTDNTTAAGIANRTVRLRRSKAMAMRYFWVQDRSDDGHFLIYWDKGVLNLADYYTKHFPVSHHRAVRPTYHPPPSS